MKTRGLLAATLAAAGLLLAPACGDSGAGATEVGADATEVTDVRPPDDDGPLPLPEVYDEAACGFCVPEGSSPCGCTNGQECVDGAYCAYVDPLDCRDRECGPDGNGWGSCGTCPDGFSCDDRGHCGPPECTPDCTGKACGDDGCGGSCRSWDVFPYGDDCEPAANGACWCMQLESLCAGVACGLDPWGDACGACPEGQVCAPDRSACQAAVFGTSTRVDALYVPASPDETGLDSIAATYPSLAGSLCPDVDQDGLPDHGAADLFWQVLPGFGVDANALVQTALADAALNLLIDLGDAPASGPFAFAMHLGQPAGLPGDYHVTADAVTAGAPLLLFDGAELANGRLDVGPYVVPTGNLLAPTLASVGIPPIDVEIDRLRILGTVDGPVDDDGIAFRDGSLGAVLYKADVDRALYLLRRWCANAPDAPEDACGTLQIADLALLETFLAWDKDYPGCGKKIQLYDAHDPLVVVSEEDDCQAISFCLFWSSEKAKITGLAPPAR